jgi:hypothetical protein
MNLLVSSGVSKARKEMSVSELARLGGLARAAGLSPKKRRTIARLAGLASGRKRREKNE